MYYFALNRSISALNPNAAGEKSFVNYSEIVKLSEKGGRSLMDT